MSWNVIKGISNFNTQELNICTTNTLTYNLLFNVLLSYILCDDICLYVDLIKEDI